MALVSCSSGATRLLHFHFSLPQFPSQISLTASDVLLIFIFKLRSRVVNTPDTNIAGAKVSTVQVHGKPTYVRVRESTTQL